MPIFQPMCSVHSNGINLSLHCKTEDTGRTIYGPDRSVALFQPQCCIFVRFLGQISPQHLSQTITDSSLAGHLPILDSSSRRSSRAHHEFLKPTSHFLSRADELCGAGGRAGERRAVQKSFRRSGAPLIL